MIVLQLGPRLIRRRGVVAPAHAERTGDAEFMEKEATGRSLDGHAPSAMAEPLVIRESESKPLGFCRGLAFDWSHSVEDSHTLVFAVTLLISCSLDNITQAKASALNWQTNPWVCRFCFMYFPAVAGLTCVKFLGRAVLRTLACGGRSWADRVREDESPREFTVRALWIMPCTGWFTLIIMVTCLEGVFVALKTETTPELSNARQYLGVITRGIIAVSFIAGSVTLLHAMRRRDTLLLRTCILGNSAFAFSMLIMIVVAYAALPNRDELITVWNEPSTYFTLAFSIIATAYFLCYAAVCISLWREYAEEVRRTFGHEAQSWTPASVPGAWARMDQVGALFVVSLICLLVTALNVASVLSDPEGYWNNIG